MARFIFWVLGVGNEPRMGYFFGSSSLKDLSLCRLSTIIKSFIYNKEICLCCPQCKDFEKAGATIAVTPCDVVEEADITFSCVADPQAAKEVN